MLHWLDSEVDGVDVAFAGYLKRAILDNPATIGQSSACLYIRSFQPRFTNAIAPSFTSIFTLRERVCLDKGIMDCVLALFTRCYGLDGRILFAPIDLTGKRPIAWSTRTRRLAIMICTFVRMDHEHWGAIILDLNSHIIYFGSSSNHPITLGHLKPLLSYINPLSAAKDQWTVAMKNIKPLSTSALPQLPDLGALAIAMAMEQWCNTHANWSRHTSLFEYRLRLLRLFTCYTHVSVCSFLYFFYAQKSIHTYTHLIIFLCLFF